MKFLDKILLKQNVKSDINAINLIYEKAEECLVPLVDIYIVNCFGNGAKYDAKTLKDLSISLTTLSSYLKQLYNSSTELKADMNTYPDILKSFKRDADLALKKIEKLHKDIFELDLDIRKVPSYEKNEFLLKGVHYLTRLEEEINEMNGISMDIVPESAQLNMNSEL